jgi:purine nucleosidase
MAPRPILIDCDPGQDDAIMLLLAIASPEDFNILGLTTVAGNVPLDLTQRNARITCELAGRAEIPVFAGSSRPLKRELVTAEHVHGGTGIDGFAVYEPAMPLQETHAVDFLVETLLAADDDSITVVPTGPLTNIAAAITQAPEILPKIHEIVLMGGAMREGGNITPCAEFNIYVDPHAAHIIFQCGRPLTVAGLDLTHQAMVTPERSATIGALGNKVADAVHNMLEYFNRHDAEKYGTEGGPLHDPCTIAYLLRPELFQGKPVNIEVEIHSELTMGATAVDYWGVTNRPKNANWLHTLDSDGFFELLTERLGRF